MRLVVFLKNQRQVVSSFPLHRERDRAYCVKYGIKWFVRGLEARQVTAKYDWVQKNTGSLWRSDRFSYVYSQFIMETNHAFHHSNSSFFVTRDWEFLLHVEWEQTLFYSEVRRVSQRKKSDARTSEFRAARWHHWFLFWQVRRTSPKSRECS